MPQLHITGWRYGLQKVSMSQVINSELHFGLANAKACVDQVLEGKTVVLEVDELSQADQIARRLDVIGANVEVHP